MEIISRPRQLHCVYGTTTGSKYASIKSLKKIRRLWIDRTKNALLYFLGVRDDLAFFSFTVERKDQLNVAKKMEQLFTIRLLLYYKKPSLLAAQNFVFTASDIMQFNLFPSTS